MNNREKLLVGCLWIISLIVVAVVFYFVGYDRQFKLRDNLITENSRLKSQLERLKSQLEQKKYEPLLKYEPFFRSTQELGSYYGFSVVLPEGWIMEATVESHPTLESTTKLPSAEWIEELQINYFFEPKLAKAAPNFSGQVGINISDNKNVSWQLIKKPQVGSNPIDSKEITVNGLPGIIGTSYQKGNTRWHQAAIAVSDTVIVHLSFLEASAGDSIGLNAFTQIYQSIKKI